MLGMGDHVEFFLFIIVTIDLKLFKGALNDFLYEGRRNIINQKRIEIINYIDSL